MNEQEYVKAINFVIERHRGQTRIGGRPYLVHPISVGLLVSTLTEDIRMIQAAFLHDILEDTKTSEDEIRQEFGEDVLWLVKELTNNPKLEVKDDRVEFYINKLSHMSEYALLIKLADRLNNVSDLNRAKNPFRAMYKKETEGILIWLYENIYSAAPSPHRHLINKIDEQLSKVKGD